MGKGNTQVETPVEISMRTSNKTSFLKERYTAVYERDKCVIHFRISTTGTLGLVGFKKKLQVNNAHYYVHGCNRVPSSIINNSLTTLCVDSYYVVVIRFLLNFSKLFHNLWKGAQQSSIDLPIQQLRSKLVKLKKNSECHWIFHSACHNSWKGAQISCLALFSSSERSW